MEQELRQLGLEEKEIKIYLSCLAHHTPTPTLVAKQTGLKRATVYLYLERLKEKGLIEWEVHKARKRISPVSPRRGLKQYLNKKKEAVLRSEQVIKDLLTEIEKVPPGKASGSKVYHYEGAEGVQFAIDKILSSRKDLYWLGSMETLLSATSEEEWYQMFTAKRLQHGIATYGITDRRILRYPKFSEVKESKRYFRFLDDDFTLPTVLGIFGGSICLVSRENNKTRVVLVENALMAQTLEFLFKALWTSLSKEQ